MVRERVSVGRGDRMDRIQVYGPREDVDHVVDLIRGKLTLQARERVRPGTSFGCSALDPSLLYTLKCLFLVSVHAVYFGR